MVGMRHWLLTGPATVPTAKRDTWGSGEVLLILLLLLIVRSLPTAGPLLFQLLTAASGGKTNRDSAKVWQRND